jgi:hypothetical protein
MSDILGRFYAWFSVGADPFTSLDDLDPCAFDDDDRPTVPQVVGCVFGGGRSDELPEIPLAQAVQVCHDISAKIDAWCGGGE